MKSNLLENLNSVQKEAVEIIDSPLLIVAGAGSGKTNVITHKIAFLVLEKKLMPRNILGVTFTNRAADEMKARIQKITKIAGNLFSISTFHSLGLRILRESGESLGFAREWQIVDDRDQKRILEQIVKENIRNFSNDFLERCRRKINLAKMDLLYPNDEESLFRSGFKPEEIRVFSLYFEFQQNHKIWDYEDLVSFSVKLLQNHENHRKKYCDFFQYVVVDEFQDTNPNQYELIKLLAQENKKITVVGDDDQAIYSWRGASIRFLFDFEKDFPGLRIIKLEQNYRSTQPILDFANNIIESNLLRRKKSMWTEKKEGNNVFLIHSSSKDDEAEKISNLILRLKKTNPDLFPLAVLYRINSQSLALETAFLKHNIHFKIIKGLRFFDRKEIKDCLALLKLTIDPHDNLAFARVIDFLPLGIGPKTVEQLLKKSKETEKSLFLTLKENFQEKFQSRQLFKKIEELNKNQNNMRFFEILNLLLDFSKYLNSLDEKQEHSRILNVKELLVFMEKWETNNPDAEFIDLLDRMSLESLERKDEKKKPVYLLTMHNAKGTEFQTVIIAGVNAAYMPFFLRKGYDELEEEKRLFYVGATRAIQNLIVSTGSQKPSYFLQQIQPNLYRPVYESEELFHFLNSKGETEYIDSQAGYIEHPVFGKGKIIKEISKGTYLIDFNEKGEKLIDTSVVNVQFC
jgi:DNA helicase-2/ATP-dependent DNA helicase PcrA